MRLYPKCNLFCPGLGFGQNHFYSAVIADASFENIFIFLSADTVRYRVKAKVRFIFDVDLFQVFSAVFCALRGWRKKKLKKCKNMFDRCRGCGYNPSHALGTTGQHPKGREGKCFSKMMLI